jgi:hypothetical protein
VNTVEAKYYGESSGEEIKITGADLPTILINGFLFVLIIQYSLYLEYDSPLVPSASGLAG